MDFYRLNVIFHQRRIVIEFGHMFIFTARENKDSETRAIVSWVYCDPNPWLKSKSLVYEYDNIFVLVGIKLCAIVALLFRGSSAIT